jgi:hypothetical protein
LKKFASLLDPSSRRLYLPGAALSIWWLPIDSVVRLTVRGAKPIRRVNFEVDKDFSYGETDIQFSRKQFLREKFQPILEKINMVIIT